MNEEIYVRRSIHEFYLSNLAEQEIVKDTRV